MTWYMSPSLKILNNRLSCSEELWSIEIQCFSIEGTAEVAKRLSLCLGPGFFVGLSGELGAGKTEFVRQLVLALGGNQSEVASPTFVLECRYDLPNSPRGIESISHWDFYRLASDSFPEEVVDPRATLGTLTLVEWSERCAQWVKYEHVHCRLSFNQEKGESNFLTDHRRILVTARNKQIASSLLECFENAH